MARILYVEDDPSVRISFLRWLKFSGHEFVAAEDGKRALQLLGEQQFDGIITDNTMPGMTGRDLLACPEVQNLRLRVLLSGDLDLEQGDKGTHWEISKNPADGGNKILDGLLKALQQGSTRSKPGNGTEPSR